MGGQHTTPHTHELAARAALRAWGANAQRERRAPLLHNARTPLFEMEWCATLCDSVRGKGEGDSRQGEAGRLRHDDK